MSYAGSATDVVDWFAVLGVPYTATTPEVRSAFRRAAGKAHPDRGGGAAQFQRFEQARKMLADEFGRSAAWRQVLEASLPSGADTAQIQSLKVSRDDWRQSPPPLDPFGPLTLVRPATGDGPAAADEVPHQRNRTRHPAGPTTNRSRTHAGGEAATATRCGSDSMRRWFTRLLTMDLAAIGLLLAAWWVSPATTIAGMPAPLLAGGTATVVFTMLLLWARTQHLTALSDQQRLILVVSLGLSGCVALAVTAAIIFFLVMAVVVLLALLLILGVVKAFA